MGATVLAFGLPLLLAFNAPPSPTLLNEFASLGLAGSWATVLARDLRGSSANPVPSLLWAVAALLVGLLWSSLSALPSTLALGLAATLLASALVVRAGSVVAQHPEATAWFGDFCWALCAAGIASSVIGCVQVFAPSWPDGELVARSAVAGRAVGNLRQPNHLSSLALWSLVAIVALHGLRALRSTWACAMGVLCLFAVVLTGSRTGVLGVVLLAAWGALDRRLSRGERQCLLVAPIVFTGLWLVMSAWAHAFAHVFGGEGRMSVEGDISSSRFAIWSNTLTLLAREPLTGVGVGEFNLAWTLSAFPDRPTAFFDHTHNLPLQLWVELGVPLGTLVLLLLLLALYQSYRRAWACAGQGGVARRAAFMMVLMIGLHSLLEYPLWYAYFLLPTAFAWGFALSQPRSDRRRDAASDPTLLPHAGAARALTLAGVAMSIGAAAAVTDYWNVVAIYDPPERAAPLEERIALGQRSPLFGHHADYAAATAFGEPKAPLSASQQLAFRRAPHQLLDVRLMIAWSQALAVTGDLDKARWLAARVKEFRNPGADEYFAPCNDAALAAQAFQCQPPQREVHWREFTRQQQR
jgi:O-antigen ligase